MYYGTPCIVSDKHENTSYQSNNSTKDNGSNGG